MKAISDNCARNAYNVLCIIGCKDLNYNKINNNYLKSNKKFKWLNGKSTISKIFLINIFFL